MVRGLILFPGNNFFYLMFFLGFFIIATVFINARNEKLYEYKKISREIVIENARIEQLNQNALEGIME